MTVPLPADAGRQRPATVVVAAALMLAVAVSQLTAFGISVTRSWNADLMTHVLAFVGLVLPAAVLVTLAVLILAARARVAAVVCVRVIATVCVLASLAFIDGLHRWTYLALFTLLIAVAVTMVVAAAMLRRAQSVVYFRVGREGRTDAEASVMGSTARAPAPRLPVNALAEPSASDLTVEPTNGSASIFISYRRVDNLHAAHRLHDYLATRFGADSLFIDLDTIQPGADFVATIEQALATTRVMLVVIGAGWLGATSADGRRRLDDPTDYVRLEIESALRRNILVVPVLVDVSMPSPQALPESLRALAVRNAVELRGSSFRSDCARLASHIGTVLQGN